MTLIEQIKAERAEDGTCTQGDYIRAMEAALLAADELAARAEEVFKSEYHNTNHIEGAKVYYDANMQALAAYRAAVSGGDT